MTSPDVPAGDTGCDHGASDAMSDAERLVTVPPALARPLRDLLSDHVVYRARVNGVTVSPVLLGFLADLDAVVEPPAPGSAAGTSSAPSATVEAVMTVTEVAGLMGASPEYVRRLCRRGRLRARRPGREWLIDPESLKEPHADQVQQDPAQRAP
ncbi:helix-turn-helix domain-containing protein [Actinomadura geliboluensis]|uniref:helix-turn-helix domain-containing protein n=1 Tax=Actinomadura geliboluensis TaxID=882440 RepID=UPI003716161E